MSRTPSILFVALAATILLSTMLGFSAVEKLQRVGYPPFNGGQGSMFVQATEFSDDVLLFFASHIGKITISLTALGVPALCIFIWHKQQRPGLALSVMFCTAAVFGWFGIRLYIHAMLDAIQVM